MVKTACQCRRQKRCRFDPGSGRSPEVGNGYPHQSSCLENPMDRGAWRATVSGGLQLDVTERPSTHRYVKIISVKDDLAPMLVKELLLLNLQEAPRLMCVK